MIVNISFRLKIVLSLTLLYLLPVVDGDMPQPTKCTLNYCQQHYHALDQRFGGYYLLTLIILTNTGLPELYYASLSQAAVYQLSLQKRRMPLYTG